MYFSYVSTVAKTYLNEKSGTPESRYVGLMSATDYGFSALQSEGAKANLKEFSACKS